MLMFVIPPRVVSPKVLRTVGQANPELRTLTLLTLNPDRSAVSLDSHLAKGQSESAGVTTRTVGDLGILVKDSDLVDRGHPGPLVDDPYFDLI